MRSTTAVHLNRQRPQQVRSDYLRRILRRYDGRLLLWRPFNTHGLHLLRYYYFCRYCYSVIAAISTVIAIPIVIAIFVV